MKYTWWKYSSSRHSTHASEIITGLHSLDMSHALIKIIFKEVRWSSDLKSKLFSTFCLNASSISACLDMSVANIRIIISWRIRSKRNDGWTDTFDNHFVLLIAICLYFRDVSYRSYLFENIWRAVGKYVAFWLWKNFEWYCAMMVF